MSKPTAVRGRVARRQDVAGAADPRSQRDLEPGANSEALKMAWSPLARDVRQGATLAIQQYA